MKILCNDFWYFSFIERHSGKHTLVSDFFFFFFGTVVYTNSTKVKPHKGRSKEKHLTTMAPRKA